MKRDKVMGAVMITLNIFFVVMLMMYLFFAKQIGDLQETTRLLVEANNQLAEKVYTLEGGQ